MLHLYHYACYYYKKAAYLRPTDARMWCAVGSCTLKLVRLLQFRRLLASMNYLYYTITGDEY